MSEEWNNKESNHIRKEFGNYSNKLCCSNSLLIIIENIVTSIIRNGLYARKWWTWFAKLAYYNLFFVKSLITILTIKDLEIRFLEIAMENKQLEEK